MAGRKRGRGVVLRRVLYILRFIEAHGRTGVEVPVIIEVARADLGIQRRSVYRYLAALAEAGEIDWSPGWGFLVGGSASGGAGSKPAGGGISGIVSARRRRNN